MHVNRVHHVTKINCVAKDLGEDENWLFDVAYGMDVEDGVIWVENLINLIKIHKDDPTLLKRGGGDR